MGRIKQKQYTSILHTFGYYMYFTTCFFHLYCTVGSSCPHSVMVCVTVLMQKHIFLRVLQELLAFAIDVLCFAGLWLVCRVFKLDFKK